MEDRKVEFPISPSYCKGWTVRDAIREIIANAKDESGWYSIWYNQKEGRGYVKDKSAGIAKEHLVLGGGRDKTQGEIGQFKEGLKIAALVMARENRDFLIKTRGFSVRSSIGHSSEFDTDVMVLSFNGSSTDYGTEVSFRCEEGELRETQALFRKATNVDKHTILTSAAEAGKLYINGVYVQDVDSLFGYDIVDKSAANRDRTVLDMSAVRRAVAQVWENQVRNESLIRAYLRSNHQYLEHTLYLDNGRGRARSWRKALRNLFGPKVCLGDQNSHVAEDEGYFIFRPVSAAQGESLANCYVPYATDVARSNRGHSRPKSVMGDLTPDEKLLLTKAKQMAEVVMDVQTSITVMDRLGSDADFDKDTNGRYCGKLPSGKYKILLARHFLEQGFGPVTGVIVHEIVHGTSGCSDLNRRFEHALTMAIGEFAEVLRARVLAS